MAGQRLDRLRATAACFGLGLLLIPATARGQGLPLSGQRQSVATLARSLAASPIECLLVLRSSSGRPQEAILQVCGEDRIGLADVRAFVSLFRAGVGPAESVAIDVLHNHPETLLIRAHSSTAASYRKLRRALGLHSLGASAVKRQIRAMRSGALPEALLPPSTDDLVTALKVLLLSESEGVGVEFHVYNVEGSWRIARRARGWKTREYMIKSLLLDDHIFGILHGTAQPRSDLERHYSALFREYCLLRNRIAQVFSQEAFDRYEGGDLGGVVEEQLQKQRWLRRLYEVSQKLGLRLEFQPRVGQSLWPTLGMPEQPPEILALDKID